MPKTAWKTILFATQKHRHLVGSMWFLIILGNVLAFSVPYFFKLIADYALENQDGTFEVSGVLWPIALAIAFLLLQEVCFRVAHIIELYAVIGSFDRITSSLYHNLISRPSSYFEDRFSGELGRRVEQIGESVKYFMEHFPWEAGWAISALTVSTALMYIAHPVLLTGLLIWMLLFILTSIPLLGWQFKKSKKVASSHAALSGRMIDSLANIMLVHTFSAEKTERANFRDDMNVVISSEKKERWVFILNKFHQGMSVATLGIMLIAISVYLFDKSLITVGDFILVASTLPSLTGVIWTMGDTAVNSIRNYGNLTDAVAHMQTTTEKLSEGVNEIVATDASIMFNDISFTYPGTDTSVFNGFDLTIKAGDKIGIVGSSGAGKSTLIKLLLRQYELDTGQIVIGDFNIEQSTIHSLRNSIAFVPQDTTLFHRTLLENIQYAKPGATKGQVLEASKKAHTHEFIETLPEKYETKVGERGVKLSGGQRQRIAIARAMLKDAPILVLDEATSALDSESEEIVQKGLQELFQNRTVIAVAHRLSTLREMNRIIVIEDGKIIEDDDPKELLAKGSGVFKELWEHQKGGFVS